MFSWIGQSWYDGTTASGKGYPNGLGTLAGGLAFPMGNSAVEAKLNAAGADCVDFLAAMKSASYYQLQSPITYSYTATPVACTGCGGTATGNSGSRIGVCSISMLMIVAMIQLLFVR